MFLPLPSERPKKSSSVILSLIRLLLTASLVDFLLYDLGIVSLLYFVYVVQNHSYLFAQTLIRAVRVVGADRVEVGGAFVFRRTIVSILSLRVSLAVRLTRRVEKLVAITVHGVAHAHDFRSQLLCIGPFFFELFFVLAEFQNSSSALAN